MAGITRSAETGADLDLLEILARARQMASTPTPVEAMSAMAACQQIVAPPNPRH
jgi:hypothetical protein